MKKIIFLTLILSIAISGCNLDKKTNKINTNEKPSASTEISRQEPSQQNPSNGVLDLSNQNLTQIPSYVFGLKNLKELNVSNNKLTGAIQAEIRQLENLKILNASNNQMTGVPAEIGQLEKLEMLDLSNNQFTGLPYELGNLQNLKVLNISGNKYSQADLDIISEKLPANTNIIK